MKKIFAGFCLLNVSMLIYASEYKKSGAIQLPSSAIIKQRLKDQGLSDLINRTSIDTRLGDKNMSSLDVMLEFESAASQYCTYLTKDNESEMGKVIWFITQNKETIMQSILQEHSAEFEKLKSAGYFDRFRY